MRLMVTGTRLMGVCRCPDHVTPCNVGVIARQQMDSALWRMRNTAIFRRDPVELLHGDAEGADTLAAEYWEHYRIGPVQAFPANWAVLGRRAGPVRNQHMIGMMPDLVVGFPWVKRSHGTRDALRRAREAGIPTQVFPVVDVCPHTAARVDY